MQELEIEGLFWLSSNPDDKVAGRLRFDAVNGAELNLIGSFHGLPTSGPHSISDVFFRLDAPVRVLGIAGRKLLTLEHCKHAGITLESPGLVRERYWPRIVLAGAHFEDGESLDFSAIHLEIGNLEHWVWRSGILFDVKRDDSGSGINEIQVNFKPPSKLVATTDIGDLELEHTYRFRPDPILETTIAQACSIGLRFIAPRALEDAVKIGSDIQDFLTIAVHSPSPFRKVIVSHSVKSRRLPGGREVPVLIDVYHQFRGSNLRVPKGPIHPSQMLFTFSDIGGLDGVAKWLDTSARYSQVVDSLLSHWYMPAIYADNRLLNTIIAAEAFERIRRQQQYVNFSDALQGLIEVAGAPFRELVKDVDVWVKEIVQARTNNLVHSGLHGRLEGQRMYDLSESLYFLVVLCLLRESGFAEETLTKIQEHQSFKTLADILHNAN